MIRRLVAKRSIVTVLDVPGKWRYQGRIPALPAHCYLTPVDDDAKRLVSWWPGASISTERRYLTDVPQQKETLT